MSLVRFRFWARRCSSMVEHQPSKLNTWVRFPSPALKMNILFIMREWLSWWSTTLPRSGSRVRVPSRALLIYKRYPKRIPFVYKRVLPDSNGSYLRSTSVGANGSPLDFQHPVSRNAGLRRTRTVRIFVLLRLVLTEVHWTSSTPSRAMKDSVGLEGSRSPLCSGRCRGRIVIFYSFIRDEGVAGAVFLRNKSTYWPLAWLVLNSETHV